MQFFFSKIFQLHKFEDVDLKNGNNFLKIPTQNTHMRYPLSRGLGFFFCKTFQLDSFGDADFKYDNSLFVSFPHISQLHKIECDDFKYGNSN